MKEEELEMRDAKESRKNKRGEKAITLIALVVSIIVLLILAGISIMILTGENGILQRAYGYRSDMDMLQRSFKAQFKAVDRAKAKVAILIGNTEVENNQVTIKDLKKKEQTTVDMEDMIETLDHILIEEHDH